MIICRAGRIYQYFYLKIDCFSLKKYIVTKIKEG